MSKVLILEQTVFYKTYDETIQDTKDPNHAIYMNLFQHAKLISKYSNVPCPDIGLSNAITVVNEFTGILCEEYAAYSYHINDFPQLHNSLILVSLRLFDETYASNITTNIELYRVGVLAHEIRHIWQKKYDPEIVKNYAQGYVDSLFNPAEVDADGFGIWFLSNFFNISHENAASILCASEKIYHPKAYTYRLKKAKELESIYTKTSTWNKNKKFPKCP